VGELNHRVGKVCKFLTEIAVYLGNVTRYAYFAMERQQEVIGGGSICVVYSVPMTWSDLERLTRGSVFQADLLNNARTV